jgi:hypothetical protein
MVTGILLPSTVMQSGWFQVLAAFVALNTLIYAAISIGKFFPKRRG